MPATKTKEEKPLTKAEIEAEAAKAQEQLKAREEAQKAEAPVPPMLPTEKSRSAATLSEKFVVIHGPPGVGKSTLASTWAGGNTLFLNCAGELGEFEVYQVPVGSWSDFRKFAWAVKESDNQYGAVAIDTGDALGRYCSEKVRKDLGITHESDLDWGKGWSTLRDEFYTNMAKLAAIPNTGIVVVTHSDEKEVKTRSATWDKWQFRGVKGIRETLLDMADLVLFLDFMDISEGEEEKRVIRTKPSRYWDAKERGSKPRLPAAVEWPLGSDGFALLQAAWDETKEA